MIQNLTTQRLGLAIQYISTIVTGLIIAFLAGWKLSLVVLAAVPVIILSSSLEVTSKNYSKDIY